MQLASHPFPKGKPLPGAQIDWTSPYNKSAKSCWLFNEGCGFRVADIVGGNHGTFTAGTAGHYPEWTGGVNTGVRFKGASEGYVRLAENKTLYSATRYTILVWFRPAFQSIKDTGQALVGGTSGVAIGIDGNNKLYHSTRTSADRLFPDRDYVGVCKSDGSNTDTLWLNGSLQGYGTGGGDMGLYMFGRETDYTVYFDGKIFLVRVWDRSLRADEIRSLSINPYLGITSPRAASYFIRRGKAFSATFSGATVVTAGSPLLYLGLKSTSSGSTATTGNFYRKRGVSSTSAGSTAVTSHLIGRLPASATSNGATVTGAKIGFKIPVSSGVTGASVFSAAAKVSKVPPYIWSLPVFSFEPDWQEPPTLGMNFITDVQKSDSGIEERNARLDRPKITTTFFASAWNDHEISHSIEQFIETNIGQSILVPLWSEAVRLNGTPVGYGIPIGDDATTRLFQPTRPAMLWKSPTVYSLIEITSAGATQIGTLESVPAGYSEGDIVVPLMVTDPISQGFELQWLDAFHASGSTTWNEAAIESEKLPVTTTLAQYRGLPIFPFPFNWSQGFSVQRSQRVESIQSETSIVVSVIPEANSQIVAPGSIWLDDRLEIGRAWSLFCGRRGRHKKVWLPTGKRDLVLTGDQGITDNLTCVASGYVTGDFPKEQRRVLFIMDNGSWYARKVTNAALDAYGNEVITVESVLPALSSNAIISFLLLTRFDVDDIGLTFNHGAQCDWQTTLRELPDEYTAILTGTLPATGLIGDEDVLIPS